MIQFSNGISIRKDYKMTGKELIMYILQNDLENKQIFENGTFLDFITIDKAASKFGVGAATIRYWVEFKMIPSIMIGNTIFIPKNVEDPRIRKVNVINK